MKPKTREDCRNSPRPCPYVSCHHHMIWAKGNRPNHMILLMIYHEKAFIETLLSMKEDESCVLDIIERRGTLTLKECGNILGVTRERIRQNQESTLKKLAQKKEGKLALSLIKRDSPINFVSLPSFHSSDWRDNLYSRHSYV